MAIFGETVLFLKSHQPLLPTYFLSKLTLRGNPEILKNDAEAKGIRKSDCSSRPTLRLFSTS